MANNDNVVEEIKSKLDITTLVAEYTELKKAGRNYKALCPFHKEKSPSFMISPEKQIAYCFGCQKGGDIFAVVMETEHIGFPEAVQYLAEKTGVEYTASKKKFIKKEEKENYYDVMQHAVEFFEQNLKKNKEAQAYLKQRGISNEIIKHFHIGYAEDSYDHLWKTFRETHGYETELLHKVGLLGGDSSKYFDKFRKRVLFPIYNATGHAIGFGGRILGEGEPKYLNTADTPIYNKSQVLFGLDKAKEHIKEKDYVIVVEGYTDVTSSVQHGIKNVVATSGTAMTKEQIRLLKRYTSNIYLFFDNDKAGFQATVRNGEVALSEEVNIYVMSLPNKDIKDVDEYFQQHQGEALDEVIENKMPFFEYVLSKLVAAYGKDTIEGKRKIVSILLPMIKRVTSAISKEHYIAVLSLELGSSVEAITKEVDKIKIPKIHEDVSASTPEQLLYGKVDAIVVAILLAYPQLLKAFGPFIEEDFIQGEFENTIYKHLSRDYTFGDTSTSALWELLNEEQKKHLHMLQFYVEKHQLLTTEDHARSLLREKIKQLYSLRKKYLLQGMKKHEASKDPQGWKQTFDQLRTLQVKEQQLDHM